MKTPTANMDLSPKISTNFPAINPDANRVMAKAESINPIAAWLTPKERANTGIAGTIIPNPTATKNPAPTSTFTSRGKSASGFFSNLTYRLTSRVFACSCIIGACA